MPLSTAGVEGVKAILDATIKDGFPGLSFSAIDKSGNTLVEHASGTLGLENSQPLNTETTFWIASCTKLVTAIAALQLVEQDKMPLDDAEFVAKIAPEIKAKKVFADGVNGVEQEKGVTVRMLLAHTAGFAYCFIDPRVQLQHDFEGKYGDKKDILDSPMVNQPGSMWEYGISIDWVGILIERITGLTLGTYFSKHIFQPLGIPSSGASFFPSADTQKNLAQMNQRAPDGTLAPREHLFGAPLHVSTQEAQDGFNQSGGGGLFAKPKEYVKILGAILNDGVDPKGGKRILEKKSVDLLWENQIPEQPDFARSGLPPANTLLVNQAPEFYPQPGNPPQGWGFGGFLTIAPGPTGRGENTLWWMGLANCFWWIDRQKGVAGVLGSQVLPNGDAKVIPAWFMAEKTIYDNLE